MKRNYMFFVLMALFLAQPAMADDTDIYGISEIDVRANVLILFDNSGSMSAQDVPGDLYDPAVTYAVAGYETAALYYGTSKSSYSDAWVAGGTNWQCIPAKDSLDTLGYWKGKFRRDGDVVSCENYYTYNYRTGNYLNFLESPSGGDQVRMVVAKRVVANLINDDFELIDGEWVSSVNWGVIKFNPYSSSISDRYDGGYVVAPCGSSKSTLIGSFSSDDDFTDSNESDPYGVIGGMFSDTYTPLAETLTEVGRYFAGSKSLWNGTTPAPMGIINSSCSGAASDTDCYDYGFESGDTYDANSMTPIQYRCQKSYVIIITDGEPTRDESPKIGGNDLADVSGFLFGTDLRPVGSGSEMAVGKEGDFESQTVKTYTIGFATDLPFLEEVATNGGGEYYAANNVSTLQEALSSILSSINQTNEGFSAAAVPVSQANKAYAGNFVYYGLFQPTAQSNWVGNLKKYSISDQGVLMDASTPPKAATSGGVILPDALSFWSTSADGPDVLKGGAGAKLKSDIDNNSFTRKIYTYTNSGENDLTDTKNAFTTGNTLLTSGIYSGLTSDVITSVRAEGEDAKWPFGSFLHSQPLVAHYSDGESMVFAGANDGMLHCIDDADGSEKWSFIPRDLLSTVSNLHEATTLQHFVDGTPILYGEDSKKILVFGERRGGFSYTALDVSSYTDPELYYEISPSITAEPLGQSWSIPQEVKMATGEATYTCVDDKCSVSTPTPTKDVFVISGGYDDNQDNDTPGDDTRGRAVLAFGSDDGALFSAFDFNASNYSNMTHSIIAARAFENPKTRTTTRAYAADLGGNLFGFRDDIFHRNRSVETKGAFSGLYDGLEDGVWGQKVKLFSSPGKKVFYPPNIVNEYYPVTFHYEANEIEAGSPAQDIEERRIGDFVFYGTGDRAHPSLKTTKNSFYAIKNHWDWGTEEPVIVEAYVRVADGAILKRSDDSAIGSADFILDVTDDLYQVSEDGKKFVIEAMSNPHNRGWYIDLVEGDGSLVGEKVVSSPIIFAGVVYFTTYIPEDGSIAPSDDPCDTSGGASGTGYLYSIGYNFGESVVDYEEEPGDPAGHLNRKDRRVKLKVPGIPPAPVLVVHEGKSTIITGFETTDPDFHQSVETFYWRQLDGQ